MEYVAPSGTNYSAARSLYEIWDDTDRLLSSVSDVYSRLGSQDEYLSQISSRTGSTNDNLVSHSSLVSKGFSNLLSNIQWTSSSGTYGLGYMVYQLWQNGKADASMVSKGFADLKANIQTTQDGSTYGAGYMLYKVWQSVSPIKSNIQWTSSSGTYGLGYMVYQLWQNGKADASMVSKGFADLKANIQTTQDGSTYGAGYMLYKVWQSVSPIKSNIQWTSSSGTYGLGYMVYQLWQNGKADASMVSKGFSDVIAALDSREVVVDGNLEIGDVTVDQSGVEDRLDTVIGLLMLAGAKDAVDDLLGDFSEVVSATQIAAVQSAMQNAFPFCVPAVVKQILGLLAFEGAPPVYEFDIGGAPLVLDFSEASDFAQISRWVVTVAFVIGLLVNTKRFVFDFTGGVS